MGNASTKNIIETSIDLSINVITTAMQDCATTLTQDQLLQVIGDGNSVSHVNFRSMMNTDISCMQETKVQNDISSKISNKMEQMAKSILGALSLNPGNADAENIIKNSIKLGTKIQSAFNQKCGTEIKSSQTLKVQGDNNIISFISFDQAISLIKNCVSHSSAVNDIKNDIENTAKQIASAEKKGISLMFLAIIVIGIVMFVGVGGTKIATSPAFIGGVVVLVFMFLAVMFITKKGPFKEDTPAPPDKETFSFVDFVGMSREMHNTRDVPSSAVF